MTGAWYCGRCSGSGRVVVAVPSPVRCMGPEAVEAAPVRAMELPCGCRRRRPRLHVSHRDLALAARAIIAAQSIAAAAGDED